MRDLTMRMLDVRNQAVGSVRQSLEAPRTYGGPGGVRRGQMGRNKTISKLKNKMKEIIKGFFRKN